MAFRCSKCKMKFDTQREVGRHVNMECCKSSKPAPKSPNPRPGRVSGSEIKRDTDILRLKVRENDDPKLAQQKSQYNAYLDDRDRELDMLSDSIARLGNMATTINTEIKEQNVMIDEIMEDVEVASENVNTTTTKADKLIKGDVGVPKCIVM